MEARPFVRRLVDLYGYSFLGDKGYPPKPRFASNREAGNMAAEYRDLKQHLSALKATRALHEDMAVSMDVDIASLDRKGRAGD